MAWLSLKIQVKNNTADLVSDALMGLGALSASIEDSDAETPNERPIFGEPGNPPPGVWDNNVVSALFDDTVIVADIMKSLSQASGIRDLTYSTEIINEQDWVRVTQSQFDPIRIQDDLWIVPTWHTAPNPDALNIVLDPGLAFGTGSHPTTHLCLAWLVDQVKPKHSVLDYGCGSGILAIAAKKLGAVKVLGVDIDTQAIESSNYNAEKNAVAIDFCLPNKQPVGVQYDLVVANILSSALSVLAPALASACKQGGKIALSGILQEQTEQVSNVYMEWFEINPPILMDCWVLLTGIRK